MKIIIIFQIRIAYNNIHLKVAKYSQISLYFKILFFSARGMLEKNLRALTLLYILYNYEIVYTHAHYLSHPSFVSCEKISHGNTALREFYTFLYIQNTTIPLSNRNQLSHTHINKIFMFLKEVKRIKTHCKNREKLAFPPPLYVCQLDTMKYIIFTYYNKCISKVCFCVCVCLCIHNK